MLMLATVAGKMWQKEPTLVTFQMRRKFKITFPEVAATDFKSRRERFEVPDRLRVVLEQEGNFRSASD